MLKHLPDLSLHELLRLFNQVWKSGILPITWHEAYILPLLKPDKNPTNLSSYRPISLTNSTCELIEKIVNSRLRYVLERNNSLDPLQFGFRRNRSTIDLLINLQKHICDGLANGQITILVSFDLAKAFDRIDCNAILQTLQELNLKGNLPRFIKSFLSTSKFRIRLKNHLSKESIQENGTPQGSVINPTLFILALSKLSDNIAFPVKYPIYADVLVIYITGDNVPQMEKVLQLTMTQLQNWFQTKGLLFSSEKTECMTFTFKKTSITPHLQLAGLPIDNVDSHRLLRLIFDRKLSWKPHILNLKLQCINKLSVLKNVHHQSWGADRKTLQLLYNTLILSKLGYGATVYGSAAPFTLHQLDILQNQAIRIILDALRSSPIPKLLEEANKPPLSHRRSLQSYKCYLKICAQSTHKSPIYSRKNISSPIQLITKEIKTTQYSLLPGLSNLSIHTPSGCSIASGITATMDTTPSSNLQQLEQQVDHTPPTTPYPYFPTSSNPSTHSL